jgi:RNA polymerase sigma-70 factor (ECF subfamily)
MRFAQAGVSGALDVLAARYRPALVRVAESRLGQRDWAEEAVQETLLSAFRSRHTYDPGRAFRTWLWTILLNACSAIHRSHARHGRVANWTDQQSLAADDAPASIDAHAIAPDESPLGALLAKERAETLDRLLGELSEPQADALRLRFFAGLKFEEIAEAMNCALLTAKNRVKFGLLRLSERLRMAETTHGTNKAP